MKPKKKASPKRQGIAIRFNSEDNKLLMELQKVFKTTEVSSTLREAMIRAGEHAGIRITRVAEGVGYRVDL